MSYCTQNTSIKHANHISLVHTQHANNVSLVHTQHANNVSLVHTQHANNMYVKTSPPDVDSHIGTFGVGLMVTDVVVMETDDGDGLGMAGVLVTFFGVPSTQTHNRTHTVHNVIE